MDSKTDGINFIETESQITSSQQLTLSTTPYARDQPNSFPPSDDDDIFPQTPDEDEVIFCSPPPTPELNRTDDDVISGDSRVSCREEPDAVDSLSEVLRVMSERKRRRAEEEETEEEVVVDFLETAIRRGHTFPKPRWSENSDV